MPAPKLVAGFCPDRSQVPPELIVTAPVNVLVPVAPVAVLMVPVTEVVPLTVKAALPIVKEPLGMAKLLTVAAPVPVLVTVPLMEAS